MSDELRSARLWRAHELLGTVPISLWACVHLWEQWAAFAGRDAWSARMTRTSHGLFAIAIELLFAILPALAWIALEVHLRVRETEPEALRWAMAEQEEAARRLGLLARFASWVFFAWLIYHAGWLWLRKLTSGSEPLLAWMALRDGLGTYPHAILHAIGLTAFTVHFTASIPRLAIVLGVARTRESRRAARLSGLIVALGLLLLYAQLAGWHAAGRGTIWSL